MDLGSNLSPGPLAQLGLAKTDVHAGADTTNGSGVKLQELKDASFLAIGPEMTGSSCYPNGLDQATSDKLQAASNKLQATSSLTSIKQ